MAYRLKDGETSGEGIRRLAREQLDGAIAEATDTGLDGDFAVHEVRKRTKKLRALLRLARDELGEVSREENVVIRDAARELSYVRDAASVLESYDGLLNSLGDDVERRTLGPVRDALTERRHRITGEHGPLSEHLAAFAHTMRSVRERIGDWPLSGSEFDLLGGGFAATYERGRKAMRRAYQEGSAESFHEWRKQAKGHWYHLRVLQPIWASLIEPLVEQADALCDLLGDEHDLTVLAAVLRGEAGRPGVQECFPAIEAMIDERRRTLRARARPLGLCIYAESPKAIRRRFEHYWRAWRFRAETDGKG